MFRDIRREKISKEQEQTIFEQFEAGGGSDMSVEEVLGLVQARADFLMAQDNKIEKGEFLLQLTQLEHDYLNEISRLTDKLSRVRDMKQSAHQAEYDGLIVTYYGDDQRCWFEARAKGKAGFQK